MQVVAALVESLTEAGVLFEAFLRDRLQFERHDQACDNGHLGISERRDQPAQPAVVDDHVIVREGDDVHVSLRDAPVASDGKTRSRLAHVADPLVARTPARDQLAGARRGAVVDDDDLETLVRERGQRAQAAIERALAPDGRNDHSR